jgi:hypothetical protein
MCSKNDGVDRAPQSMAGARRGPVLRGPRMKLFSPLSQASQNLTKLLGALLCRVVFLVVVVARGTTDTKNSTTLSHNNHLVSKPNTTQYKSTNHIKATNMNNNNNRTEDDGDRKPAATSRVVDEEGPSFR